MMLLDQVADSRTHRLINVIARQDIFRTTKTIVLDQTRGLPYTLDLLRRFGILDTISQSENLHLDLKSSKTGIKSDVRMPLWICNDITSSFLKKLSWPAVILVWAGRLWHERCHVVQAHNEVFPVISIQNEVQAISESCLLTLNIIRSTYPLTRYDRNYFLELFLPYFSELIADYRNGADRWHYADLKLFGNWQSPKIESLTSKDFRFET